MIKIIILLIVLMVLTTEANKMDTDEYHFTICKWSCSLFK